MTDINKLYTEFAAQIDKRHKELIEAVRESDLVEQDLLHFLESESCDAVTMVMIAKQLQANRRERRQDKVCLEQIQCIKSTIPNLSTKRDLSAFETKHYTFKSDVMSKISHKPKKLVRCKYEKKKTK